MEACIAYHCGPALAGIKPANLVACYKATYPNIHHELARLNRQLNGAEIYLDILCECDRRVLIMVYRKTCLADYLCRPEVQALLRAFGYRCGSNTADCLTRLKRRMRKGAFPHEIGAFLGYPTHDIYGFLHHRDVGCLLTGEWKVYRDAEGAKQLFARYQACRCALLARITEGKTLFELFVQHNQTGNKNTTCNCNE